MKKILFFLLIFCLLPGSIMAINGLGTLANPYHGTITSDTIWNTSSNKIYVNDNITVTAHLTINQGLVVVFLSAGADLIITGNGILTASGGSGSNMIQFTADFNNNGVYGEPGETWGHISFQNMTGTANSLINYCIIEYGQKNSNPQNIEAYGGGLYIQYSNLTISNSIIRNNYAGFGGGILITQSSPTIKNCIISNNIGETTGGGILISNNSPLRIENCIIEKNTCNGVGGGGGIFIGGDAGNTTVYNCVIVSNTSLVNYGHNVRFYYNTTSQLPQYYNSIIWGSYNSINYDGQSVRATDFNNCAIQGYTSGYTSCINLSATNGDPTGPNFIDPNNLNYSINFISPCRDAGISSGAPLTDYLGNSRVGPYDIGAYEVQYSRWKSNASTSNWNTDGNWVGGVPNSSSDVIIPHISGPTPVYPTGSPRQNFTLGAGKMMILEPGAQLTLGTLTNTSGTLRLLSDADSIASLIIAGYVDNGNDEIQLYLEGNSNGTLWHYVSPPVTSLLATILGSSNSSIAKYEENLISNNMNNGWVTYNGYHYDITLTPPSWVQAGLNWLTMDAGSGYNYFSTANKTYTLNGTVNVSDVRVNLVYNSGGFAANQTEQGYNLIGNPFTCGLDWAGVVSANSSIFNVNNVETTIYFRLNGVTIYYNNGFTVPDTYNFDGSLIPPMQGFFIKTNANVTLNLPASAKTHTTNKRYKGNSTSPHIRLQYENSVKSDQTVIYFDEKATLGFDKMLDGRKAFLTNSDPNIYSVMDGINYSINAIPFPDSTVTVPLVVNAVTAGSYTIKATELTGLEKYKVYLNDKTQNIQVDLADVNSYTFDLTTGTTADRFTVTVTTVVTAVPESTLSNKPFNIYSSTGSVNIQTLSDIWNGKQGGIRILDMTGKVFTSEDNVEFSKDALVQVPVRAATGIYMVELRSGTLRYVGKVVIR